MLSNRLLHTPASLYLIPIIFMMSKNGSNKNGILLHNVSQNLDE